MRKPLAIALASLLLVMSLTSVAFAQSSVDGYTPDEGAVQNQIQGNDDTGTPPNATQEATEPGAAAERHASRGHCRAMTAAASRSRASTWPSWPVPARCC